MKLWLLRPIEDYGGAWRPWYDKCFGAVVAAETEEEARGLIETSDEDTSSKGEPSRLEVLWSSERLVPEKRSNPWLDPTLSTCVELESTEAGQIIQDFRSA